MEKRLRATTVGVGVIILALVAVTWWRTGEAWGEQFAANLFAGAIIGLLAFGIIDWWFGLTKARWEREERRKTAYLITGYLMEPELVENRNRLEDLFDIVISTGTSGIRIGERYEFQKTSWLGLINSGVLLYLSIDVLCHLRDAYAGLQRIEREAAEIVATAEALDNWPNFVMKNIPEVQTSINFALRALGSPYDRIFALDGLLRYNNVKR